MVMMMMVMVMMMAMMVIDEEGETAYDVDELDERANARDNDGEHVLIERCKNEHAKLRCPSGRPLK